VMKTKTGLPKEISNLRLQPPLLLSKQVKGAVISDNSNGINDNNRCNN